MQTRGGLLDSTLHNNFKTPNEGILFVRMMFIPSIEGQSIKALLKEQRPQQDIRYLCGTTTELSLDVGIWIYKDQIMSPFVIYNLPFSSFFPCRFLCSHTCLLV